MSVIYTLGDIPFPNEVWDKDFITRIATGMRMGKPKYASSEIYSKIISCWEEDSALRPTFESLKRFFTSLDTNHSSSGLGEGIQGNSGNQNILAGTEAAIEESVEKQSPINKYENYKSGATGLYENSIADN